jgi:copper transport protein
MRRLRQFILIAFLALLFPAAASAHATIRSTTPRFATELQAAPHTIRLHFDQTVRILPGSVEVLNTSGKNFAGAVRTEKNQVIAAVRPLPRGAYTVRWHAISSDSHVVSGVWTFGVRVPAPPVVDAYGAGGPTTVEHVVRWLWFLALALTIGSLGFRLICLRGLEVPRALERRLAVAAGLGVAVALQVGIAAFSLRAEDALQLSFGRFLYGDLSPMTQTRFGQAFIVMTLGFAVVLALIFLSWLTDRVALLVPAFVFSIILTAGLSVSGHDGVDAGSWWLTEVADWVHITGASLWIGGLATMVALVWHGAPELRRTAFFRFSRLAMVLVAVVLTAGTYLSIVRLPHLRDLWTQGYGQVLLVKIALVGVALAWGGVHHFLVRPRLERLSPERANEGFGNRVGRSLLGESLVGMAVLLAAAVLVDSKPPPQPLTQPPAQAVRR